MILNVSGRTDIVAFYTEWFINRYKEGFLDVRNPFNPNLVSRIYFEDVDLILFCTKNPKPIIEYLTEIKKPVIFHVTLTPYLQDIEPNVPNKEEVIENIKEISKILGKDNVVVRYDPIFISEKYNIDYHIKAFDKLCSKLNGYINHIIISFMDEYKNVINNKSILNYKELREKDYELIGTNFSLSAKKNNMTVSTCYEERDLTEYGLEKGECLSHSLAYMLTGKKYKTWKRGKEQKCSCVEMVDIGAYNSCKHLCKYCYANYDEKSVITNIQNHDKSSSLLIGHIKDTDIIKKRK